MCQAVTYKIALVRSLVTVKAHSSLSDCQTLNPSQYFCPNVLKEERYFLYLYLSEIKEAKTHITIKDKKKRINKKETRKPLLLRRVQLTVSVGVTQCDIYQCLYG